jgi:polysaccharide pyruvyl transferase WcaK-like protein
MKIFHFHLGYGTCNYGDKLLAMGAKNIMAEMFHIPVENIHDKDTMAYDNDAPKRDLTFEEILKRINPDDYDLIFIGGGGWLGDASPLWWFKPVSWYKKLKVPYVVYGIGYNAPRSTNLAKMDYRCQLANLIEIRKNSRFFSVRADGTKEKLEEIGFNPRESPDPAYWVKRDETSRLIKGDYAILNISGDGIIHRYTNNKVPPEQFCAKIKHIVDFLTGIGIKVFFAKHVPSDGMCFNYVDWNPEMVQILDWNKMLKNGLNYYSYAKMVIGMRGHSQVIPIALKIPTISISTVDKNTMLMDKLGLSEYNVEVNDPLMASVIESLIRKIDDNPSELIKEYEVKLATMRLRASLDFGIIKDNIGVK